MALFDAKSKVIAGYQKSIEDKELKIRQFYDQIGRLYYGQYADINVDVTKEINQRCENITAIKNEIENLEVCILYEKGLKRCPHCRTENGLEYDFCFKCGEKFVVATPEAEVQPATETSTEAPADNKVVHQTTNGTYEEITILMPGQGNFYNPIKDGVIDPLSLLPVEGQGDVIDDEFAYVEGQGDVIDDEFAYVEGQGDVIDDQFAVTPEAEAAVEA